MHGTIQFIWTEEREADLRRLFGEGKTGSQIAHEMGCSRSAILGKLHRMRLGRGRAKWTAEDFNHLRVYFQQGDTLHTIEEKLGNRFTRAAIISKLHRLGLRRMRAPRPPKVQAAPRKARPPAPQPVRAPVPDFVPLERHRCTLLDLTNETCRWPYGDVGSPDFFFCGTPGADLAAAMPYCSHHMQAHRA